VLADQFIPLGLQHITFHDALLGGHQGCCISRRFVMEQPQYPTSGNLQLGRLVADALADIERLGYSGRSRDRYRAIWEHLIEFARRKELGDEFSPDVAARFLEEYRVRRAGGGAG
jgi:hypothetical protein